MVKNKKLSKKTIILLSIVVGVVLVGGAYAAIQYRDSNNDSSPSQETINYGPPTEEEKQQAADNKNRIVAEDEKLKTQPQQAPGTQKTVKPVLTAGQYNDQVEVSGYMTTLFEDGGTCTATLTQNGQTVTKKSIGVKEGSSTYCPQIIIKTSELPSRADWSVVLNYNSATATGASDSKIVSVK